MDLPSVWEAMDRRKRNIRLALWMRWMHQTHIRCMEFPKDLADGLKLHAYPTPLGTDLIANLDYVEVGVVSGILQLVVNGDILGGGPTIDSVKQALSFIIHVMEDPEVVVMANEILSETKDSYKTFDPLRKAPSKEEIQHIKSHVMVDNHLHGGGFIDRSKVLREMKIYLRDHPNDLVEKTGETFREYLISNQIDLEREDAVNMGIDLPQLWNNFPLFNECFSPFKLSGLKKLFLKPPSKIYAYLLKEMIDELSSDRTFVEIRLTVSGANPEEWTLLANWFFDSDLDRCLNAKFIIQIPRKFEHLKKKKKVANYAEFLKNLFLPVAVASLPSGKRSIVAKFLQLITDFDSVDDESDTNTEELEDFPFPDIDNNPSYNDQLIHLYLNVATINRIRASTLPFPLNTFGIRPHSGETGGVSHLATGFLLARNISHGINLVESEVLELLYLIARIGISIAPLSNNVLYRRFIQNPFPTFLQHGHRVALSSDDGFIFNGDRALQHEYELAIEHFKLTTEEVLETKSNSVLMSSYDEDTKAEWILTNGKMCPRKTGLSENRIEFMEEIRRGYMRQIFEMI